MRITPEQHAINDQKIAELRAKKIPAREISNIIGMSTTYIDNRVKAMKLKALGFTEQDINKKKPTKITLSGTEKVIMENIKKCRITTKHTKSLIVKCVVCEKSVFVDFPQEYAYSRVSGNYRFYCCTHKCFRIADDVYEKQLPKRAQWQKVDMNDYEE